MTEQQQEQQGSVQEPVQTSEPFVMLRVVRSALSELDAHPHPGPHTQRKKQSVRVGDKAFVEYWVEGPRDTTYMMLYLRDSEGSPIPQFKEPLCSVDFDPRDFQRAVGSFFRGPKGPKHPLAPSTEENYKNPKWNGRQNPFSQSLKVNVAEKSRAVVPHSPSKKKVKRHRRSQLQEAIRNLRIAKRLLLGW